MQSLQFPTTTLGTAAATKSADSNLPDSAGECAAGSFDELMDQALSEFQEQDSGAAMVSGDSSGRQTVDTEAIEESIENSPSGAAAEFVASLLLSASQSSAPTMTGEPARATGENDTPEVAADSVTSGVAAHPVHPETPGSLISTAAKQASPEAKADSTGQPDSLRAAIELFTSTHRPDSAGNAATISSVNAGSGVEPQAEVTVQPAPNSTPSANTVGSKPFPATEVSGLRFSQSVQSEPARNADIPETDQPGDSPSSPEFQQPEVSAGAANASGLMNRPDLRVNSAVADARAALEASGTSGAKYPLPMQKAEKVKESAGLAQQNLPVTETATAAGSAVSKAARELSTASRPDKVATSGPSHPAFSPTATTTETHSSAAPETAVLPIRSIERAHDMIALHAFRIRDLGNDSMQVVIKPDPNLHLALNVQMREGVVEVSAQLQKGDFDLLNRHWAELQQQLEPRGIRLAPLNQPEPNASHGNNSSQSSNSFSQNSRRETSEEKPARTGAFAEFALSSVLVPKRTNKITGPRGWESWA